MDIQTAQQAYNEILAHIKSEGSSYSKWYAGVASDWQSRLFVDHQVPRQGAWYIARQCSNDAGARNVEDALLKLGCDGGPGGGHNTCVFVYAYLKTTVTNP